MDNFFNSVFAAAAAGEEEEEEREGEEEQAASAAERDGGGDFGGGWSFGGLIKTFADEMEAQRGDHEEGEQEAAAAAVEAEEEGGGSGGGWSFGGLIKTLAEELPQREEEEAVEEEEEEEREQETEAAAAEEDLGEGDFSGGGWSFGGLMKTFASRSESVLEGYRRDLQDLGTGLRLETTVLRQAAVRAAAALPGALEAGASVASDRLESVGQAVDDLGAAAAGLLSHANEALRSVDAEGEEGDGDRSSQPSDSASGASWRSSLPSKKYTRFEAQVLALRADPTTFTEEPEDAEGFTRWQEAFNLDERKEEIDGVLRESPGLESFVERLVPSVVAYDTFWCRYFFAVDKLRQAEDVRTKLVSRAMSKEDEEELSWEVDDEEEDSNGDRKEDADTTVDKKEEQIDQPVSHEAKGHGKQTAVDGEIVVEDKETPLAARNDDSGEHNGEALIPTPSSVTGREEKTEPSDSSKESDLSVVSQPSMLEEDISWEEIEDVGDQDEKKGASPRSSSTSKAEDIRKRLNSVEDDEELSWDVDE
ncbi:BSD domain-containing protein 1 [Brachypodium distachyon]|nr:BSD domain-containing protein 1 [Brachypodium distachyon]|eukprot:XP_003565639.1 BSD domain-containing protein 1 [Brachypodium distachyon]